MGIGLQGLKKSISVGVVQCSDEGLCITSATKTVDARFYPAPRYIWHKSRSLIVCISSFVTRVRTPYLHSAIHEKPKPSRPNMQDKSLLDALTESLQYAAGKYDSTTDPEKNTPSLSWPSAVKSQ